MKVQDIAFLVIFLVTLFLRKPKLAAGLGIACLITAIPLFYFQIFFTAQRLTWYAAAFFFISILFHLRNNKKY